MNINDIIEKEIIKNLDLSKYSKEIDEAVAAYFASEAFKDQLEEALNEESLGYDLAEIIAKDLKKQIKGKISVVIKGS